MKTSALNARDRVVSIAAPAANDADVCAARSRAREALYGRSHDDNAYSLRPKPSETLMPLHRRSVEAARAFSQGEAAVAGSPDAECFKMTAPTGKRCSICA